MPVQTAEPSASREQARSHVVGEHGRFAALAAADHYRLDGPHALALMAADGTYLVSFAQASG